MNNSLPTVAVIMSTYNGGKYLPEQLDSILAQEGVNVELFIRDDGSTDNTRAVLSDYEHSHSNIHVQCGENLGFAVSFINTLLSAPQFKYYAFSDQDDYWKKEKLAAGVKAIRQAEAQRGENTPVLYHCNLYITDEKLNIKRKTNMHKRVKTLEGLTLRRSTISGCTMVMNAALREVVRLSPNPVREHDNYIQSLCIFMKGTAVCDPEAYILYRQHSRNVIGLGRRTLWQKLKLEWDKLANKNGFEAKRAQMYLDIWRDEFDPEARKVLTVVANYQRNIFYRLKMFLSPKYRTGELKSTFLGKLEILLGRL